MSRIGNKPIPVPKDVQVEIDGAKVVVKGTKGTLIQFFNPDISILRDGDVLRVTRPTDNRIHRALHGLTGALVANMVIGVGYNGLASGHEVAPEFWKDRDARRPYMIHAEANCLSLCKKGEVRLIAVTLLPCSYCATLIASYGVQKVVYRDTYETDNKAVEILAFYGISLHQRGF